MSEARARHASAEVMADYRRMLLIRRFEEAAYRAYEQGEISGTVHTSVGQEAVAVGVTSSLREGDWVLSHHRAHGHALAKGVDPGRLMAELFGRWEGVSHGKGGSMHITDVRRGFLGSLAVVGGSIPVALGAALSTRVLNLGNVVAVFFGDGAINQGVLYETLNLAAIWQLPILFVCENNGFAISVRAEYATAGAGICNRAAAFGIHAKSVDGQDLNAVREATISLLEQVRLNQPAMLECKTYRFMGHSRGDPPHGLYRTEDEVAEWRRRDPLEVYARSVELSDADVAESEAFIDQEMTRALEFARSASLPSDGEIETDVWGPDGSDKGQVTLPAAQ